MRIIKVEVVKLEKCRMHTRMVKQKGVGKVLYKIKEKGKKSQKSSVNKVIRDDALGTKL